MSALEPTPRGSNGKGDLGVFANYITNIIVGRLGKASASPSNRVDRATGLPKTRVSQPSIGIAVYNSSGKIQYSLGEKAVENILNK